MYASWDIKCKGQFFVISGHFLPFDPPKNPKNQNFEKIKKNAMWYYHFTLVYHRWRSYVWFPRHWARQTVFLDYFLPFYPPNNPENLNFEKLKKSSGDIVILHKCTINDNHMMYGSWDMKCEGAIQNFFFGGGSTKKCDSSTSSKFLIEIFNRSF